jgi:hypothetical protein
MIRKLLVGRLTFTPDEDDDGRFYLYEGRADRLHPIRGTVRAARALATPGGLFRGLERIANVLHRRRRASGLSATRSLPQWAT